MTSELAYRISQEEDLPALLRLWEDNSTWGPLAREECKQMFIDTPYGPSITPVAVDVDGVLAGQIKFVPCRVEAGGNVYKALNMHAMILRKDIRVPWSLSKDHPIVRLYNIGVEAARASGYSIVYSLPVYAWRLFFRWLGPFSTAEFVCWNRSLSGDVPQTDFRGGIVPSRVVGRFEAEYLDLWGTATRTLPIACGLRREPAWLQHKADIGGHFTIEVREQGEGPLVGYCTIERGTGLIDDLLARTRKELSAVIEAASRLLTSEPALRSLYQVNELRAMSTPLLEPVLNSCGFDRTDYKFAFVCTSLDPALPLDEISAEKWYVSPAG
jgi:hypothetical protein